VITQPTRIPGLAANGDRRGPCPRCGNRAREQSAPNPGDDHYHGCGSVTTPTHPWTSRNSNGGTAWGTHWLVAWEGRHGNCTWAKTHAKALASRAAIQSPRTWAWKDGDAYQRFKPFQDMTCILAFHSDHKTYHAEIRVLVDPDPRYIHFG
jgi:hypothetical protein